MPIFRGAGGAGDATNDATVTAVQAAATSAATSATNAANSATAAANSATGAATSATNASNSATTAAGQATTAANSATNSATFATNSSLSADDSADSATESEGYASEAFDYKVAAASSASSASTSATNAAASSATATTAVNNALSLYGDAAALDAAVTAAQLAETNAETAETNAETAATTATNAASTATTQATNAAASAVAADADATAASLDANEAQAAATAAQAAVSSATAIYGSIEDIQQAEANSEANRDAAAASATSASNSASASATSATNSATSASAAATSAAAASAVALGNEPVRHSVRPSLLLDFANTKTLDPRITFTRASTGTFYDGKTVAKAEENSFLQSQDFDQAIWGKTRATVTANSTTAPDGTTTADSLLQATGQIVSGVAQQAVTAILGDYVISVHAKPNGKNFIILSESIGTGSARNTWFNLSTGAVGTANAGHTATITASTNGFYRCSIRITTNAARSGTVFVYVADTDNSTTVADDTLGVYLWGAQLEQRSSVTAYTPTTTAPITNYIPALQSAAAGVARFEHNPVTGESLGLEIEEQRTNLVTYSDDFANAIWVKTNSSITANTIVAPDGSLTGDKHISSAGNSVQAITQTTTVTTQSYTTSLYLKYAGVQFVQLLYATGISTNYANFDLVNGTVTAGTYTSASITSVGNGWYRCTLTSSLTAGTGLAFALYFVASGTASRTSLYTGDGYSGIYIWGAQLEAGAFATSYIPTVASQVTRSADSASMTGTNFSSWYRADEGTLYGEGVGAFSAGALATINTSTSFSNMIVIGALNSTNEAFRVFANGAAQTGLGTLLLNTNYKLSLGYARDNVAGSINGAAVLTDTSVIVPSVGMDTLQIGRQWNSNMQLGGTIKKLAYYPKRLTNAEIQGLTTV